jgi:hypothetical protein
MKPLWFILVTLFWGFGFALPFQDPIPGSYRCFSSQVGPFEENVEDIGATLEFTNATTYRFTTASATEEGTVSSYTFESNEEIFDTLWQGASVLKLQPSSGSAAYEGAFFVDTLGASYAIIQNNNGLYIRCQSDGADIAATFNQGSEQQPVAETATENETTSAPVDTTTSSENLTPLQAVQSGVYGCSYQYENTSYYSDGSVMYSSDEPPDIFILLLYDDGSTLIFRDTAQFVSQYEKGAYSFDAANSKVTLQGGRLGGITYTYGSSAEGKAVLSYIETKRENQDEWINTYRCEQMAAQLTDFNFSLADSTPTIDLTNVTITASKYDSSINPNIQPVQDTYYCYPSFNYLEIGEGLPRYLREYVLEILPNNKYTFGGQEGTFTPGVDWNILQWQSGPLNPTGDVVQSEDDVSLPHSAYVNFDTWGSEIDSVDIPSDNQEVQVDCFQGGAREQKALLDFALEQPTPGNYACLPSGDNPQQTSLELLPNNHYKFNGEEGSYHTEVGEYSSDILWESGPLANSDTGYSADDSTGLREITFSSTESYFFGLSGSSTEQTMFCQTVVGANLIPKYASTTATPPPAGTGGLEGFYAHAEYDQGDLIEGQPPVTTWSYYHFLPNGYVYQDGYSTGDECNKTYPNGLPVCKGYSFSNNQITLSNNTAIGVTQADGGNLLLDGVLYENKTLSGVQTLNGTYEYATTYSSPIYMQIGGSGTNAFYNDTYTFSPDGTYSFASSSYSQTSAPDFYGTPGDIGALSSSGSSNGDSGSYTIDGNVITFKSAQGFTTQCGFFFPQKGDTTRVNICGTDYDPPSKE